MDPFVTLTAAAAATKKIKLGTGVCLVQQARPIQTAKLVASIDQVSQGRFLFGIGGGWNAEEMEDHGTVFQATRFKLVRERIEAMKAIWTENEGRISRRVRQLRADDGVAEAGAEAASAGHVGGAFPHGARRAIRYGDGWIPHSRRPEYGDVTDFLPQFHQMAAEAGRDLAEVPVTVWGIGEDLDRLKRYEEQGVARLASASRRRDGDTVMPMLDRWASSSAVLSNHG